MMFARGAGVWMIACAWTWASATTALDAGRQAGPADPVVPTAIEEALIEHACGAMRPAGAPETDAYLQCRNRELLSLRDEFGRDLRRLSNAERRTIDSACSGLRISRGQDAYVECLAARLAGLRGRGSRARTDAVPAVPQAPANPPEVAVAVAPPPVAAPSSGWPAVWIGGLAALLVAAGGGAAFVASKARRAFGTCRTCGVKLPERGDLCQKCRHEAAEALRRAAAARVEQARAQEEEQRRQAAAREDEQRQQQARDEESARRQAEEAQLERARLELEAQRQRDEDAQQRRQTDAAATEEEFDPYAVLGVPHDASVADIEAAYQAARVKYDLELVADLGAELQAHYKRKGQAVERAYESLAARRPQ